jgi:hypothetical protein
MSVQHTDNDMVLPRAGLLAYFDPSTVFSQIANGEYLSSLHDRSDTSSITLLPHTDDFKDADAETVCSLWDDSDSYDHDDGSSYFSRIRRGHRNSMYAFCCLWCAVSICILGAFGTLFAVDLVFTLFGMGTGMARWMVAANRDYNVASQEVSKAKLMNSCSSLMQLSTQMHFCLTSPNHQVPGPQKWRYIKPDGIAGCTTEVVRLFAAVDEQWKLRLDDENIFGDELPLHGRKDLVTSVENKVHVNAVGDDHAVESETER